MPNAIKYSTSAQTLALKKGNYWIGTGDVGKGPTSTTDYYNGITPPSGGYTIYLNKASGGPSIYTAANDSQLISLSNTIAGQTFATAAAALAWFATQTDKMVFNADCPSIVTDGLILHIDSGFTPSYPTTGTTWYDVTSSGTNGTLTNGPSFSSTNGGSILFDGVDDYVQIPFGTNYSSFTINFFFKLTGTKTYSYAFSTGGGSSIETFQIEFNDPDAGNTARTLWCWWKNTSGFDGGLYIGGSGTSGDWNDNTWRMLTFTHTGSTNNLFINGSQATFSTAGDQTIPFFGGTGFLISIGRRQQSNTLFYQGNISIVSVYNRVLSAAEVLQNYNAQKGRFGL